MSKFIFSAEAQEKFWKTIFFVLIIFLQFFFVSGMGYLLGIVGFFISTLLVLAIDIVIAGVLWFIWNEEVNY